MRNGGPCRIVQPVNGETIGSRSVSRTEHASGVTSANADCRVFSSRARDPFPLPEKSSFSGSPWEMERDVAAATDEFIRVVKPRKSGRDRFQPFPQSLLTIAVKTGARVHVIPWQVYRERSISNIFMTMVMRNRLVSNRNPMTNEV